MHIGLRLRCGSGSGDNGRPPDSCRTASSSAAPKGCGFLQSGFGGGAVLAAIVWFILAATNPWGTESWRIMFALGALPAFVCLYLRRALEESEKWMTALKQHRWAATEEDAEHGD